MINALERTELTENHSFRPKSVASINLILIVFLTVLCCQVCKERDSRN